MRMWFGLRREFARATAATVVPYRRATRARFSPGFTTCSTAPLPWRLEVAEPDPGTTRRWPARTWLASVMPLAAASALVDTPSRLAIPVRFSPGRTVYEETCAVDAATSRAIVAKARRRDKGP